MKGSHLCHFRASNDGPAFGGDALADGFSRSFFHSLVRSQAVAATDKPHSSQLFAQMCRAVIDLLQKGRKLIDSCFTRFHAGSPFSANFLKVAGTTRMIK